ILTANDTILTQTQKMGNYIEAINKRYIQNAGKYQRVVDIRAHELMGKSNMNVAVYHYTKSEEGQRLAANIQTVFKKNNVSNRALEDVNTVYDEYRPFYLAKRILRAISLLTLANEAPDSGPQQIAVGPGPRLLANMIPNRIINDFADLE